MFRVHSWTLVDRKVRENAIKMPFFISPLHLALSSQTKDMKAIWVIHTFTRYHWSLRWAAKGRVATLKTDEFSGKVPMCLRPLNDTVLQYGLSVELLFLLSLCLCHRCFFCPFNQNIYLQCRKQIFHILARHLSFAAFRFLNLVILKINHIINSASEEIYIDQSKCSASLGQLNEHSHFFAIPIPWRNNWAQAQKWVCSWL